MRRRVEDSVVHDGSGRKRADFAELEHANRSKPVGIADVDLLEQGIPLASVPFVVHQPTSRIGVRPVEFGLRRPVGGRLLERTVEFADFYRCRGCGRRRVGRRRCRKLKHPLHRQFRRKLLVSRRRPALREHIRDDVGIFFGVERTRFTERHLVVHVAVQILQRFAIPLLGKYLALERGRTTALQLSAMADRALLRVFPAAWTKLVRAEPAGTIGQGTRRGPEDRQGGGENKVNRALRVRVCLCHSIPPPLVAFIPTRGCFGANNGQADEHAGPKRRHLERRSAGPDGSMLAVSARAPRTR